MLRHWNFRSLFSKVELTLSDEPISRPMIQTQESDLMVEGGGKSVPIKSKLKESELSVRLNVIYPRLVAV